MGNTKIHKYLLGYFAKFFCRVCVGRGGGIFRTLVAKGAVAQW